MIYYQCKNSKMKIKNTQKKNQKRIQKIQLMKFLKNLD